MTTVNENIDYHRLYELSDKANRKLATKQVGDELMSTLYRLGKIKDKMYQDYTSGRNVDDLLDMGVALGAILLLNRMLTVAYGSRV